MIGLLLLILSESSTVAVITTVGTIVVAYMAATRAEEKHITQQHLAMLEYRVTQLENPPCPSTQ